MDPLIVAFAQLAGTLTAIAALAGFVLWRWPLPVRFRRPVFLLALLPTPLLMLGLGLTGGVPMAVILVVAMWGIMALSIAFLLIGLRRVDVSADQHRRRIKTDSVLYLLASVLWFTIMYWSGSVAELEALHFEVAPVVAGVGQPICLTDARFICNHLTLPQALSYSVGNLLTLGGAGIAPLDDFTRVLGVLQMVPVFIAGYIYARN